MIAAVRSAVSFGVATMSSRSSELFADTDDLEIVLFRLFDERRILDHLVERSPQRFHAILGHARRREDRTSEAEDDDNIRRTARSNNSWRDPSAAARREGRAPFEADLHEDVDLLVAKPVGTRRFPRRPAVRATSRNLALFHRKVDVVAARIAEDILNFVPRSAFMAFGYCEDVQPRLARMGTSCFVASSMVLMPDVCQVTVVLFSWLGLPM